MSWLEALKRCLGHAVPGAAMGVATVLAIPAMGLAQESYELSGDAAAIWNLAGVVSVTGGGGPAVQVEMRRGGSDGGRLEVATGRIDLGDYGVDGVESLRIVYPGDRILYRAEGGTDVQVREDGTFFRGGRGARDVRITDDGDGLEAHADLDIRVPPGKTVLVYLAAGEVSVSNVNGELIVSAGSADVRSSDTSGRLVLDTGSGDVRVDGARGEIILDTGSGDVEVADISEGSFSLDTGSGDVSGGGIQVDRLSADTGSGDVTLTRVEASEVLADTGSGEVQLGFDSGPARISVDTGSGDVTLTLPASWESGVELNTGSGDIHTDFRLTIEEMDEDYVKGRIGSGDGILEVDTGSGDIQLLRG